MPAGQFLVLSVFVRAHSRAMAYSDSIIRLDGKFRAMCTKTGCARVEAVVCIDK